jgi:hypothetical protein
MREELKNLQVAMNTLQSELSHIRISLKGLPAALSEQLRAASGGDPQQAIQRAEEERQAQIDPLKQNPLLPLIRSIQESMEAALRQRALQRMAAALQVRRPEVPDLYQRADRFIHQVQELKPALERVCGGAFQKQEYQRVSYECHGVREKAKQLDTVPAPPAFQLTLLALPAEGLVTNGDDGPALALTAWSAAVEQQVNRQVQEYQAGVDQAVKALIAEAWPETLRMQKRRLSDSARNLHMLVFTALSPMSDSPEAQQLLEQANKAVEGVGITPVVPRGEKYDPYEHEFAGTVASPGQKGRVMQVELPGYREGNRMLYKPRVLVSE